MSDSNDPPPFDVYTYEGSPAVEVSHGYLMIAAGFCLFFCLNLILQRIGPPSKVTGDVWRWRNTFVSCVHSSICGSAVLYCLITKDLFHDPVVDCDNFTYFLVAFSGGYFMYDVVDYVQNNKAISDWEVIVHHVFAIWSFWYNIQYRINIGYTVICLFAEVNSIFLHARKLLQFDHCPFENWLYKSVVFLNLSTFITFRFFGISYVGYGIVVETQKGKVTLVCGTLLSLIMFATYILNPVLLWRLVKNDVLRNLRYRTRKLETNKLELNGHLNANAMTKVHKVKSS